jgi:hypothetical protein
MIEALANNLEGIIFSIYSISSKYVRSTVSLVSERAYIGA